MSAAEDAASAVGQDVSQNVAVNRFYRETDVFPGLAADWFYGYGEDVTGANLNGWTDHRGGYTLSSPGGGQRPTDNTNGWRFTAASSQYVSGASALAALHGDLNTYTWYAAFTPAATGIVSVILSVGDLSTNDDWHLMSIEVANFGRYGRRENGNPAENAQGGVTVTAGSLAVLAATFDGTDGIVYLNGNPQANLAMSNAPNDLDSFAIGVLTRSSLFGYADATIHEVMVGLQPHTPTKIAEISRALTAAWI